MNKLISPKSINVVVNVLSNGGLVAFPTETVYGLGGNAYSDSAVASIFSCKKRSEFNPLSVCYKSLERATNDVVITGYARRIAEKFLPGPITLVLKRKIDTKLSLLCSAGLDTIGIRIPANPIALNLLSHLDFPLAAPSANTSGNLSHTTAESVNEDLDGVTILNGGKCNLGIESTIVDCSGEKLIIRRQGAITANDLAQKCGFSVNEIKFEEKTKKFILKKRLILNAASVNADDALLAFGKPPKFSCKKILNLSENANLNEAAANLFSMLQELDNSDAKRICVMPIPNTGIGKAINNRLNSVVQS